MSKQFAFLTIFAVWVYIRWECDFFSVWKLFVLGTPAGIVGKCSLRAGWVLLHAGAVAARFHSLSWWSRLAAAWAAHWPGRVWESCATQTNILQIWLASAKSYQWCYWVSTGAWYWHPYWMPESKGNQTIFSKFFLPKSHLNSCGFRNVPPFHSPALDDSRSK